MHDESFRYQDYDPTVEKLRETLCTVGNGYFATRGAAPESKASSVHYPGTYIAGCYDRLVSKIEGRKLENESIVNVPNWLPLTFRIGKERNWFELESKKILEYEQELQLRNGLLIRNVRFEDDNNRTTRISQRRFAHMEYPHLGGLETTIEPEDWSGKVRFLSALDGRVSNSGVKLYRQFNGNHLVSVKEEATPKENMMSLEVRTRQSKIHVAEASKMRIFKGEREVQPPIRPIRRPRYIGQEFSVDLERGHPVRIQKIIALYTSRDKAISEPHHAARKAVTISPSFDELVERQSLAWNHLWRRFRIDVEGDDRAALALHIHNFQLLQSASPNSIDLDVSVPARGLHGEAYRGHIFWDELFIFPLFNIHIPDLTRSLLMYRYRRLPAARNLAVESGFKGALYPWESASDGTEQTPRIQLNPISNRWIEINTPLQYHVDAAVAFNIWSYFQVTHDLDFLAFYGAEMFLEVARFFGSLSHYNESSHRYEIHGVMGPDEYHDSYPGAPKPGLNNNAYTNFMAVWVLHTALKLLELLPKGRREILFEDMDLREEELALWEDISHKMLIPFHDDNIITQFEGYEKLKELDWNLYRKKYENIQKIDSILEAEGDSTDNYKVTKQADVVMLFYLFSYDELKELFEMLGYEFKLDDLKRNIRYYLKRTTHGSTLSRIVHSWVLARMNREKSWQIAKEALESDLSDIQGGTTPEGIHVGAMAGTVEIIQRCYMGLVTRNNVLWLDPRLPEEVKKLSFTIYYGGHTFDLDVDPGRLEIWSHPGLVSPVKIGVQGEVREMKPGERKSFALQNDSQGISEMERLSV